MSTDLYRIDLQWFAAEDEGRTEQPSDYKLRKAREEGRIAKSQEINSALVMLLPVLTVIILAPRLFRQSVEIIRFYFEHRLPLQPLPQVLREISFKTGALFFLSNRLNPSFQK